MSRLITRVGDSGRSRLGWLLACFHAAWFVLAIANMSPPSPGLGQFLDGGGGSSATLLAGRPFHFHYESVFLKVLILVDVPSTLATVPIGFVLSPCLMVLHMGSYFYSYVGALLMLLGATCQWLLVGGSFERWLTLSSCGNRVRQQIHRYSAIIMVGIAIATLVLAPAINQRSRRLGLRHGGISFH